LQQVNVLIALRFNPCLEPRNFPETTFPQPQFELQQYQQDKKYQDYHPHFRYITSGS
jgi:hypothetical protein